MVNPFVTVTKWSPEQHKGGRIYFSLYFKPLWLTVFVTVHSTQGKWEAYEGGCSSPHNGWEAQNKETLRKWWHFYITYQLLLAALWFTYTSTTSLNSGLNWEPNWACLKNFIGKPQHIDFHFSQFQRSGNSKTSICANEVSGEDLSSASWKANFDFICLFVWVWHISLHC